MRLLHLTSINTSFANRPIQRFHIGLAKRILILLFACFFITSELLSEPNPAISKQDEPPEGILILELFLKSVFLEEAFIAYEKDDFIFVSLDPLFEKLEFPIDVDASQGKASGWFLEESQKFDLDLVKASIEVQDKKSELTADEVFWTEEEILISTRLLESWFPLKFLYNPYNQTMTIQSLVLLPMEERAERERRKKELLEKKSLAIAPDQSYQRSEYSFFSTPSTDLRLNYTWSSEEDGNASTMTTLSKGDLLYSTMNLAASADNEEGLRTLRFSLGRKDQEINLFGLTDITEYEVGDVFTPATDMINRSNYGSGLRLENFPFLSGGNVGTIPLNGILEAGWEVELYAGDLLIDFTTTQEDGSWEFLNVPLSPGLNIFILKFYGPTGEKNKKSLRYYYNPELVQKNRLFYRLSVNRHRENLYSSENEKIIQENDPANGKTHTIFDLEYGLFDSFTLKAGYIEVPLPDDGIMATYSRFGLKATVFGVYSALDHVVHEESGGTADQLSLITRIGKYNFLGKFQSYDGEYESEERPYSDNPISTSYELRFSSMFSIPKTFRVVYSLNKKTKNFLNQGFNDLLTLNLTFPYGNSSFSSRYNQNTYQYVESEPTVSSYNVFSLRQVFSLSFSVRSDLKYDLEPIGQADYFTIKSNYQINDKASVEGRFTYNFEKEEASGALRESFNSYALQYIHKFQSLILGLLYSQEKEIAKVALNLTTSFGKDNIQGDWIMTPIPLAEKGFITARVFFDENNNGVFDEADTPLENVKIKLNRKHIPGATNEYGLLTMEDVSAYRVYAVELDEGSLEDLYWTAKEKIQHVKVHPGATLYLDFIIERTGEIEGTIYEIIDNDKKEAGGVELELYDSEGNLVRKTKTFFDGFFLFDRIPKGEYKVKVSQEQLDQHGYKVLNETPTIADLSEEDLQVIELEIQKE